MTHAIRFGTMGCWRAIPLSGLLAATANAGTSTPGIGAVVERAAGESPSRPEARQPVRAAVTVAPGPIARAAGAPIVTSPRALTPHDPVEPRATAAAGESSVVIPGVWSLQLAQAQEELGLSAEQGERRRGIAAEYHEAMRDDAAPLADAAPEQRLALYEAMRYKQAARLESARRAVEQVLTPEQLDRLILAELRTRGAWALQSPQLQEQLGRSAQQKQKLRENREQLTRQGRQLQQEALEESLRVLSPEQVEKLRAMHVRTPMVRSPAGANAAP